jgi:hypothetical protein
VKNITTKLMENKRNTAIEYFYNELHRNADINNSVNDQFWHIDKQRVIELLRFCLLTEKNQIISAYAQGVLDEGGIMDELFDDATLYFQENYGI